jgi:ankyrin repeat protein
MKITANSFEMQQKLWHAAATGDSAAIRMLVMGGVDLEVRNEEGFTAFNIATMKGHTDTAMTILAAREFKYARALGMTPEDYFNAPGTRAELAKSLIRKAN